MHVSTITIFIAIKLLLHSWISMWPQQNPERRKILRGKKSRWQFKVENQKQQKIVNKIIWIYVLFQWNTVIYTLKSFLASNTNGKRKNNQSQEEYLLSGDFPRSFFILFTTFKIFIPYNKWILQFQCLPHEKYLRVHKFCYQITKQNKTKHE